VTVPPLSPRDPSPRRARRRSRAALPVAIVLLAVAVLALAGVWHLRGREPAAGRIMASGSPRLAQTASSEPLAPSPTPSHRPHGSLPPRAPLVASPQPVPILVYHHVVEKPRGPRLVCMSVRLFRKQMAWLARNRYQAVTLRRVYDAWTGRAILPPKPVVLTFDDGYADQVRNAAPVLRGYHWPAELDLVSGGLYLGDDPPATSLTPDMVQGLLDDGWGLESHTVSHLDVTRLWGRKLQHQLVDSRTQLEKLFDVRVDFFCFPGGIYDKRVKLAVRRAGYLAATGTRYAAATPRDLFSLPRIYAYGGETMADFGSRLSQILAAADR